jgi:hypothetical protein
VLGRILLANGVVGDPTPFSLPEHTFQLFLREWVCVVHLGLRGGNGGGRRRERGISEDKES